MHQAVTSGYRLYPGGYRIVPCDDILCRLDVTLCRIIWCVNQRDHFFPLPKISLQGINTHEEFLKIYLYILQTYFALYNPPGFSPEN